MKIIRTIDHVLKNAKRVSKTLLQKNLYSRRCEMCNSANEVEGLKYIGAHSLYLYINANGG